MPTRCPSAECRGRFAGEDDTDRVRWPVRSRGTTGVTVVVTIFVDHPAERRDGCHDPSTGLRRTALAPPVMPGGVGPPELTMPRPGPVPCGPGRGEPTEVAMMRLDALREYLRASLWIVPTVCGVAAMGVGLLIARVRVRPDSLLAFQGTADDARTLLITVAGTVVTVLALLLGLTVVALQLSSTQFSPRLLRNFLRDRSNQLVLGVIVGTFTYSAG